MRPPTPTAEELEHLWADLAGVDAGQAGWQTRRVIAGSCHDCFLAVSFPDRRRLLSVVAEEDPLQGAESRPLTSGVLLVRGTDPASGKSTVDIVLRDAAHSDIFTALVADLLSALADSDAATAAGELLLARLEDWRRLLAAVTPQGMTPEQQRGLFGELTVLADLLLPAAGPRAVLAWTGPDRQLQDFQFTNAAIEVKTVSGNSAQMVRIANERQLDFRVAGQLFLVTLALDARHGGPGQALPVLAGELRQRMHPLGMSAEFEQRLNRAGYLETQAHLYSDRRYTVRECLVHVVGEHFPKITEQDLPGGVSDVSYTVDLNAASAFRTTGQEMIRALDLTT
jgi:hypothetical protein